MVEMQIVMGHQHGSASISPAVEVMQVGPGEILAGIATAVFIWPGISAFLCRALRILTTPV